MLIFNIGLSGEDAIEQDLSNKPNKQGFKMDMMMSMTLTYISWFSDFDISSWPYYALWLDKFEIK